MVLYCSRVSFDVSSSVPPMGKPLPLRSSSMCKSNFLYLKGVEAVVVPRKYWFGTIHNVRRRTGSLAKTFSFTTQFCPDCIMKLFVESSMYAYAAQLFVSAGSMLIFSVRQNSVVDKQQSFLYYSYGRIFIECWYVGVTQIGQSFRRAVIWRSMEAKMQSRARY